MNHNELVDLARRLRDTQEQLGQVTHKLITLSSGEPGYEEKQRRLREERQGLKAREHQLDEELERAIAELGYHP